ncbi:hypothetical protein BBW65_04050 [Helicobacter enhydrae]|uniref:alpha-1,3-mannosyl-glycoprotein 2-beta-N-acetylglucosaminyltransferase n=1 Tax=Helicobacter enhydrae TaxID=222136 RepID=A0A1B1U5H3_9HELI|nr:glycosyltransferase [Helicobacter enhydrae]ANV98023.1 hypothetical protein BBW65_04050 [Helicobacter enhydrae]
MVERSLAPIVLFVYNRPSHTRQTIQALLQNPLASQSQLFIYSDAPKDTKTKQAVEEVREYIHTIEGFENITIIERERNFGLADSIIDGVTSIVNQYGKIIVLEDDIVVSPCFLEYMNEALAMYEEDLKVACISAFNFPLKYPQNMQDTTFFLKGADCWGWGTWERAWKHFQKDGSQLLKEIQEKKLQKQFDLDNSYPYTQMLKNQIKGKNNSWAVRWYASAFLKNMLCLYPKHSLVENIGTDGTHFKNAKKNEFFGVISDTSFCITKLKCRENLEARQALIFFFKNQKGLFFCRILKKAKQFLRIS